MQRGHLWLVALFLAVTTLFISPHSIHAAAPMTAGTAAELIDAINTANGTSEADTILLTKDITFTAPGETSDVEGETALPSITSDITIEGQGFAIQRAANAPEFRIIRIALNGNLTLRNTTISGGYAYGAFIVGGGILNQGILTLLHCTISNNAVGATNGGYGGGIYNDNLATLTITDSLIFYNYAGMIGGGIYSYSVGVGPVIATITDSIIASNRSDYYGGGIANEDGSNMTIVNSEISNNVAIHEGGGIYNGEAPMTISRSIIANNFEDDPDASGGGIYNESQSTLTLSNSTLVNNSAGTVSGQGGAIYNHFLSTLTAVNDIMTGNSAPSGGGIYNDNSTASFTNSIVSASSGGNCAGPNATSGSTNLADDASCTGFTNSPTINLAPLSDNGGPHFTFAPTPGSSAWDAADQTACSSVPVNALDERGAPRGIDADGTLNSPQPGDCDIGSVEVGSSLPTVQFAAPGSTVVLNEASSVSVPLTLDSPLPADAAPITVYIWVSGGTATAGIDYPIFGLQSVTFNSGDNRQLLTLNLLNIPETADKTIILSIADQNGPGFSGPAFLGTQRSYTVTIHVSPPNSAPSDDYYPTHTPTLVWNRINGAVGYEVQVDSGASFAAPYAFYDTAVAAETFSTQTAFLENGTYYWRVRALLPNGKFSAWSAVQSFVVAALG